MIDLTQSPDKLKASILQDAMQGKLTKQLPEDGDSSSEVLKSFSNKINLSKHYNIKNSFGNYKKIKDDIIPYKIPSSWTWTKLVNICELLNGRTYKRNELLDDNKLTPVLRVGNLFTSNKWYYSNLILPEKNYVNSGDLIYSWSASFGPKIWSGPRSIFHMHIWKILFSEEFLDKTFMFYLLLNITSFVKSESHGTSMKHITKSRMNDILIPIPPLAEQKRIATKLNVLLPQIDSLSNSVNQIHDLREQLPIKLRKSFLQSAMQGNLTQQLPEDGIAGDLIKSIEDEKQRLIDAGKIKKQKALPDIDPDEVPFTIPKNWQWVRLGEISKIIGDGLHGTPKYGASDYYFINGSNLKNGVITLNDRTKTVQPNEIDKYKKHLDDGTLFISINGTLGSIAKYKGEHIILGKSAGYVTLVNSSLLNYVFNYLISPVFKRYYSGQYTITTIKNIPLKALRTALVPLPPFAEQQRIVAKLDSLFSKLDNLE